MADQLYLPPAEDGNGNRLPAAIAYFYLTGTTTPVTVYQSDGVTAIGTSVTADATGVFQQVFTTSGSAIKINVTTALGAAVPGYPQDPAIRVAGTNSQASQVSFAPTIAIPDTNVQDAIETVQTAVETEATARLQGRGLTLSTPVTTTSGTATVFGSIPSWVTEIVVFFNGVSLSGTDDILVSLGPAAGIEITGYTSTSASIIDAGNPSTADFTSGFGVKLGNAAASVVGFMTIRKYNSNVWAASLDMRRASGTVVTGGGIKSLADTLTQVRVWTNGSNTFDAGALNIGYR